MSAIKNYIHEQVIDWCEKHDLKGYDAEVLELVTRCMTSIQGCTVEKALNIVEVTVKEQAEKNNVTMEDVIESLYHGALWSDRYERMVDNG